MGPYFNYAMGYRAYTRILRDPMVGDVDPYGFVSTAPLVKTFH